LIHKTRGTQAKLILTPIYGSPPFMDATTILQGLDAVIKARQEQWLSRWYAVHAEPPGGKLFHYTNSTGLLGILSSEVFWATNIEYLNDSSELYYCIALIRERLVRKKKAAAHNALWPIAELFSEAEKTFNPFHTLTLYVSCFCENGDLLSQWRGYGHAGGGYAIGIQPRHPEALPDDQPRIVLRRVLYDATEQARLIDDSITQLEILWTDISSRTRDETTLITAKEKMLSFFRQEIGDYIWCFKNPVFQEEKEWRFSYVTGAKDPKKRPGKFRAGRSSIIPFVELDLFKLLDSQKTRTLQVSEVICGPTLHTGRSVEAVAQLLNTRGYRDVSVHDSKVPLRG